MSSCCVVGCPNRRNRMSGSHLKFYRIPADVPFQKKRRQLWLDAIRRTDWTETMIRNARVCSAHFISGKKSEDPSSPDYAPNVFEIPQNCVRRQTKKTVEKNGPRLGINQIKMQQSTGSEAAIAALTFLAGTTAPALVEPGDGTESLASIYDNGDVMHQIGIKDEPIDSFYPDCEIQQSDTFILKDKMDFNSETVDSFQPVCQLLQSQPFVLNHKIDFTSDSEPTESLQQECQLLQCDTFGLNENLISEVLAQESFVNKDKLKAFTGLHNYQVLMAIFDLVKPVLQDTRHLTGFQQVLLTLVRLRVNVPVPFLSHLFGVHSSAISSVFSNVINVLNEVLLPVCVPWPKREHTQAPAGLRKLSRRCMPIIDCFEISLEKSEDLDVQILPCYRSYFAVKYLTGITPQGAISFVSKGWGGSTTDAHMTENCGFLDHLLPGDLILADRDLTVHKAELTCAMVKKHRGIKQLCKVVLEDTGRLEEVRVHVERVTGRARSRYRILHGPVPMAFLRIDDLGFTTLDKIVRVACALTNLCPSETGNHLA